MNTVKEQLEHLKKENDSLISQIRLYKQQIATQKKQIDIMEQLNRDQYLRLMELREDVSNYEHLTKTIFGTVREDQI